MEYLVTASEMRQADENTIGYFGVPQLVLMERAALAARDAIMAKWPEVFQKAARILIAVGNGNNGGDGAALARLFFLRGFDVTVFISGKTEKYSDALKKQMEILERYKKAREEEQGGKSRCGGSLRIIDDDTWEKEISEKDGGDGFDLVADALFGIGLGREITGIYDKKIRWLNQLSGKKAALDIPSGISAEDGRVLGCSFRADLTVTFGFLKRGMLLYPAKELCGEVTVADIGITEESFLQNLPSGMTIRRGGQAVSELFPLRKENSHKGSYGKVLLIAGSVDTPGAALLSGEAVLRSGAGMLQIVSPAENRELILGRLPEAMYRIWDDHVDWKRLLDWCDAVVMGPGIGQGKTAETTMEKIFGLLTQENTNTPVILDADALNLIAGSEKLSDSVKQYTASGGIVVMTPHMAEFARLLHCGMQELSADRMGKAEEFCRETGVILVSKDAATVAGYCRENGRFCYYINQTGNSGMATAGSGDVLSGILGASAGLTAAEYERSGLQHGEERDSADREKAAYFKAVYRAVYLHGSAGDRAADQYGKASMKAGDMIKVLPELLEGI